MKSNWLLCALLSLLAITTQVFAQQTEADRKLVEGIKAKAENGDAWSQCALSEIYDTALYGVNKNAVEAAKWLRKAADQGFAVAEFNLGISYKKGRGSHNARFECG